MSIKYKKKRELLWTHERHAAGFPQPVDPAPRSWPARAGAIAISILSRSRCAAFVCPGGFRSPQPWRVAMGLTSDRVDDRLSSFAISRQLSVAPGDGRHEAIDANVTV